MDFFREVLIIRVITQTSHIAGQALVVVVTYIVYVEMGNELGLASTFVGITILL